MPVGASFLAMKTWVFYDAVRNRSSLIQQTIILTVLCTIEVMPYEGFQSFLQWRTFTEVNVSGGNDIYQWIMVRNSIHSDPGTNREWVARELSPEMCGWMHDCSMQGGCYSRIYHSNPALMTSVWSVDYAMGVLKDYLTYNNHKLTVLNYLHHLLYQNVIMLSIAFTTVSWPVSCTHWKWNSNIETENSGKYLQ